MNTDTSGNVVGQQGSFPFGEAWYTTSTTTKWRFTSYERDSESGNDYAIFRNYSNRLGRFLTPDPIAGTTRGPQSWNRYSYVLNDPANLIDPLGLDEIYFWDCYYNEDAPVGREWTCSLGAFLSYYPLIYRGNLPGGGVPDRPDVDDAKKLLEDEECEKFLQETSQKAAKLVNNNKPLSDTEKEFINQETSPTALGNKLRSATYVEKPLQTEKSAFGQTVARVDFSAQSVTVYANYFSMSPLAQAQTLVHESLHLALNFSDRQLAQAATGKKYGEGAADASRASSDFQKALAEKCK